MRYLLTSLLFCVIITENITAQNQSSKKHLPGISRAEVGNVYVSTGSDSMTALLDSYEVPLTSIAISPRLNNAANAPASLLSMTKEDISGYSSMAEFIQNRLAGVSVTKNPASPYGYNIVIRGKNSLLAGNTPLFILNGIALPSFNLNNLDPNHVKSINVLKGPYATRYGSRGANGVIVINTK